MKYKVGEISAKRGEDNKAAIHEYLKKCPFKTQAECAKDLGLTQATVSRHVIALRKEYEE